MNATLLSIGIAAVLALVAALVAPFFVDWNAHRAFFESHLSKLSGREVVLAGALDVQILPMPVITARDVRVAHAEGADGGGRPPQIAAPRLVARIALTPLLKGEVRVEEIRLDEPVLRLPFATPDRATRAERFAEGRAEPAGDAHEGGTVPARVMLLALEIRDGTLILGDGMAGEAHVLRDVNLTGSADSLAGPYRGEGGARLGDALYTFRFGTGRARSNGALRTKLFMQPASGAYELAADGLLQPSEKAPVFSGTVRVGSLAPANGQLAAGGEEGALWQFSAKVSADPGVVALEEIELSLGSAERAVKFAGAGTIALRPRPHMAARLEARQIDFDRALAGAPGKAAPVADLAGTLGLVERVAASLPLPIDLRLDAEAAVISGGLVEAVELTAAIDGHRISVSDFDARLPGKARVNGAFEIDNAGGERRFDGRIRLNVQRMAQLAQWLALPPLRFAALELQTADSALSAEAHIVSSAQMVRIEDLKAWLDDSLVSGRVTYLRGDRRGIDLQLAVDSLDFDRYVKLLPARAKEEGPGDLSEAATGAAPEIRLQIAAEALTLKGVEAKALQADLRYAQGALEIDSFSLGDLGGTSIEASGRVDDLVGNADGEITAALKSGNLAGFAKLAGDLNLVSLDPEWLQARADALSPAALDLALRARRSGEGTRATAKLSGSAGGTAAEADLVFRGKLAEAGKGHIELTGTAVNRDGAHLARQIGLPGGKRGGEGSGPGSLEITLEGVPADGAALTARAGLFAAEGHLEGVVTSGEGLNFAGTGRLQAKDLGALILAGGLGEGAVAKGLGAEIAGKVLREAEGGWEFADLTGHVGARKISGALTIPEDRGGKRFTGHVQTDSLDAGWLMDSLFGAGAFAVESDHSFWPRGAFDLSLARALNGEVRIGAEEMSVARGLKAREVTLELALGGGELALNRISGRIFGGKLEGLLHVHQQVAGATMRGRIALGGARLEDILGRGAGKPAARGRFDLSAQFAGEGRNWRAIAASLGGEGSFSASDGQIESLDPRAFARLIHASDAGLELDEERVRAAFAGYLDAGALSHERIEGAFTVTDGMVTAKNVAVQSRQAKVLFSTHYDIAENRVDSVWTLASRPPGPAGSAGAEDLESLSLPSVVVVYSGPLQAVERSIDISPLTGFLTVRRLEADVRRLEEAQQEARERQEAEERALRDLERKSRAAPAKAQEGEESQESRPTGGEEAERAKSGEVSRLQDEEGAAQAEKPESLRDTAPAEEKPAEPPAAVPKAAPPAEPAPEEAASEVKDETAARGAPIPTERPAQEKDETASPRPEPRSLDHIVKEALRASAPAGEEGEREGENPEQGLAGEQAGRESNRPILVLPPPGANFGRAESEITRSLPRPQEMLPQSQPETPPENSIRLPFPDFLGNR